MSGAAASSLVAEAAVGKRQASPFDSWMRFTLPNGLRVVLAENRTVPLARLMWVCRAGAQSDPPELEGLAALVPSLLKAGTAQRSAGQVTRELDDLGADLVASADWDGAALTIELLSEDLVAGGELLLDLVRSPRFPSPALERQRQKRLAGLARRRQSPAAAADDAFARALYGATTYGRPLIGTEASLRRIRAEDLAAYHHAHYTPRSSCLVMVGSLERAAVDRLLEVMGSWQVDWETASLPQPVDPDPEAGHAYGGPRISWLDFPGARQTELRLGHIGVSHDHAGFAALQVLSAVLGGSPVSRLASGLRQRSGYTYHVRCGFAARCGSGPFVVATSVGNDHVGAAIGEIVDEIERLRREPVSSAELAWAKGYLVAAFLRLFQNIQQTGPALGRAAFEHDPAAYLERSRQEIEALEPDALLELARQHLHPERIAVIAAGPAGARTASFTSVTSPDQQHES